VRRRLVCGLLLALALAGCASTGHGAASVPRSRTFIDDVPALPTDLDPSATPTPAQIEILPSWSSELVRPQGSRPGPDAQIPPASAVVPYLATSWRVSPGGDITFQLRRGVRGPTGDPFTAADVRWSIARDLAVSPVAPYLFALAGLDTRDPVTVLGRYTVRINVTAPTPFLLGVLASVAGGIYDSRRYLAHASAADPWGELWGATNSATFAAYYISDFLPSRRIVLLANPGSFVHPYYRKVEIKQMPDSYHRLEGVLSGGADHTSDLEWKDYTDALLYGPASHASASILQTGPETESWFFDFASGPLRQPAVRRALSLAIDRAELSGRIFAGYAMPDVLALPAADGEPQPAGYDTAQARRLLASAGYPHGVGLAVYVPASIGNGSEKRELALLSDQLAQAGITLYPHVVYDSDQLLALAASHKLDSSIEDITPLLGGAPFLLIQDDGAALDPASPAADDDYHDPALTSLLAKLRNTPPGARANVLAARAAALVDADVPAANLLEIPVQNVTRSDITGYEAYAVPVTYYEYLHPKR